jgi:hypothetical protein
MEGLGELFIGIAMIVNTVITIYGIVMTHRASRMQTETAKTIKTLEVNTNSKFEQLLKVTGESEHAKGVLQGQAATETQR